MSRATQQAAADERRARVLECRESGMTLQEIATAMGVSEARVWQIERRGIQILNLAKVRTTQYRSRE